MYTKNLHFHFVGIGGIGMSGLATILKQRGYTVSGCDADISQPSAKQLVNMNVPVYQGNNSLSCANCNFNILVYIPMYLHTIPAITKEINAARERGIPTISRAELLAEIMRTKFSIGITGSHGKTTTTSLISHLLIYANTDPTVVIGGNLKNIGTNARHGNGEYVVAEADESDRSFLQLNPTFAVVTNINIEHLETYTDIEDIKRTYLQFINNLPFYGKAILCLDSENIRAIMPQATPCIITYGLNEHADITATNISLQSDHSTFTVLKKNNPTMSHSIRLPMPGKHNVTNTLAAIAIVRELGISWETIKNGLATFGGIERRFSFHGTYKGADIFDDYGHHPLEIKNTIEIARKRTKNKLIVAFQPHRYTRTAKLWHDFLDALTIHAIDTLIITDIYSAGEKPISNITSERLVEALNQAYPSLSIHYVPFDNAFHNIKHAIDQSIEPNDLLLCLGAGKMNLVAELLTQ